MDAEIRKTIESGQIDRANALILERAADSRASVGLPLQSDLTALQVAAYYTPEAAELILQQGVACDLHTACALGHIDEIGKLRNHEAFDSLAEHLTPMGFAVTRGQLPAVAALLKAGDRPDGPLLRIGFFLWEVDALKQDLQEWTPLHAASAHGYMDHAGDLIRLLVNHGADLHRTCCLGEAPIHLAATYSWTRSISVLLELGADINAVTEPVPVAIHSFAAPPNSPVVHAQTPLMIAVREGQVSEVKQLLELGADIHATDSSGATALHIAAKPWWGENLEIVQALLDAGADSRAFDNTSLLPVEHAESASLGNTVRLLRSG